MSILVTATSTGGPAPRGAGQELELRARQLGRCIGHEHEGIGRREEGQRGCGMAGVQATDTRRVDERQTAFEKRVRDAHLDEVDLGSTVTADRLLRPVRHRGRFDRLDDRFATLAAVDGGARRLTVADDRDRGRGEIVVDGAHGTAEQRVDEGALALLELADDTDDGVRPRSPAPDVVEPVGKIVPIEVSSDRADVADNSIELLRRGRDHDPSRHRRLSLLPARECTERRRAERVPCTARRRPRRPMVVPRDAPRARLGSPANVRGE